MIRWRPQIPGSYQVQLILTQNGEEQWQREIGEVTVTGEQHDDIIRRSPDDHRFFQHANGDLFWPQSINLRSVWDTRSQKFLQTSVTPPRTVAAYDAYFQRLSHAGINLVEIWAASWSMALEWRDDWPGYGGIGQYHQGHAWLIDQVLAAAWKNNIRVLLVIRNHGLRQQQG